MSTVKTVSIDQQHESTSPSSIDDLTSASPSKRGTWRRRKLFRSLLALLIFGLVGLQFHDLDDDNNKWQYGKKEEDSPLSHYDLQQRATTTTITFNQTKLDATAAALESSFDVTDKTKPPDTAASSSATITTTTTTTTIFNNNTKQDTPASSSSSNNGGVIDCRRERGKHGKWVQDLEMAKRTHYKLPPGGYFNWHVPEMNFQPTVEHPVRWATTWKWQDDHCPVHELFSRDDFCDLVWDLKIRRFLIIGDSLSIEFAVSWLSLLRKPLGKRIGFERIQQIMVLKCPAKEIMLQSNSTTSNNIKKKFRPKFNFKIWILRRSPIEDLTAMCDAANKNVLGNTTTAGTWDDASYRNYLLSSNGDNNNNNNNNNNNSSTSRSAIVFNTGAWIHGGLEEYKTGFHCMVEWIDSLQPQQQIEANRILAFFRPTNRNHVDCLPQGRQQSSSNNNDTTKTTSSLLELLGTFNYTGNPIQQSPHANLDEYYKVTEMATDNHSSIRRRDDDTYITADGVILGENWKDIEAYNDYSKNYLDDRQAAQQQQWQEHRRQLDAGEDGIRSDDSNGTIVPIYWLNTYYSTALRRDGHMGFGDCLHYALPGPTDWWVHFFYSLLLDLRNEQQVKRQNGT